jgi:hypothetical protein
LAGFRFEDFVNRRVLFKGEIASGKTSCMKGLLNDATDSAFIRKITMLDMAPARTDVHGISVGGPVRRGKWARHVVYLRPDHIMPPRLTGKTKEDVLSIARKNAEQIDGLLDSYSEAPTEVLFINDLTIYLHAGRLSRLLEIVKMAKTFVGNAYEGQSLHEDLGSGLADRERSLLADFEKNMDVVIKLH